MRTVFIAMAQSICLCEIGIPTNAYDLQLNLLKTTINSLIKIS